MAGVPFNFFNRHPCQKEILGLAIWNFLSLAQRRRRQLATRSHIEQTHNLRIMEQNHIKFIYDQIIDALLARNQWYNPLSLLILSPDNRNDTTVHSRLAARKSAISIYNIVWICGTMVSLTSCHRGWIHGTRPQLSFIFKIIHGSRCGLAEIDYSVVRCWLLVFLLIMCNVN